MQFCAGNALPGTVPLTKCNLPAKIGNWEKKVSLSHAVCWNLQSYQPCCFFPFYPKLMKIKAKNHSSCPTYFIGICENIIPSIKYYHSFNTALSTLSHVYIPSCVNRENRKILRRCLSLIYFHA